MVDKVKSAVSSQGFLWLMVAASVLTAVSGQAEVFPEPWNHIVSLLGIVGTAVNGVLLRNPLTATTQNTDISPKES